MRAPVTFFLLAILHAHSASQQTGSRQQVTPTPSPAEPIRLWGGMPKDSMILGETPNAPPGYVSTGWSLTAATGIPPWTKIASMPSPRSSAAAAAVNGKVYVIGGVRNVTVPDPHYVAVTTVDEYDPQTDTWTTKPTPMPSARNGLAAVVVNFRILVTGGRSAPTGGVALASVAEYDPATDTWCSRSPMLEARSGHLLVDLDGRVFAFGGAEGPSEEYDPAADSWQFRASPVNIGAGGCAVASAYGRIYVFGGHGIEEYDPATDTWTLRSAQTLNALAGAVPVNGRVFLVASSNVREYDPITNTVTFRVDHINPRQPGALASLAGQIYSLGGDPGGVTFAGAERFDPGAFQTLFVHRKN